MGNRQPREIFHFIDSHKKGILALKMLTTFIPIVVSDKIEEYGTKTMLQLAIEAFENNMYEIWT